MPCGHTIHKHCLKEMRDHLQWVFGDCVLWFLFLEHYKHICPNLFYLLSDMLALFAPSQFVICPRYGRNMTWRLQPHQCPNLIKTNWFRFSATIVGRAHKFSFTLWPRNAQTANLTTLGKQETEQVAMAAPHLAGEGNSFIWLRLSLHISAMACSSNSTCAAPHQHQPRTEEALWSCCGSGSVVFVVLLYFVCHLCIAFSFRKLVQD